MKMKIHSYILSLLACLGIALPGYSQVDRNETLIRSALHGLEYEIKAGFSIGVQPRSHCLSKSVRLTAITRRLPSASEAK